MLGGHRYAFPKGNNHCRYDKPFRFYHSYCPETTIFTEGQDHNDPDICDGVGFSTWKLDFETPTTGMARLVEQHVFGSYDIGEELPFRVEPLK